MRFFLTNSTAAATAPKNVCVHVRTAINAAAIRRENRDGRNVIIVPSATLPDGVVMNGVRYPAEEIEKSFWSLNNTPAPLGHPSIAGAFVSASDPRGMVRGFIGAWNENVRREGGRVHLDKVIDVEYASQSVGGKAVLEAIEKGEPIHTSTGLYAMMEAVDGDDGVQFNAREIVFDHDAILLGEKGAATPDQGVGMLVNAVSLVDGKRIEVINSALEDAERELDWAADYAARAAERFGRLPLLERIKAAILAVVRDESARETSTNMKENEVDKEQFAALSAEVKTLSDGMKGLANIGDVIAAAVTAAVKPVADGLAAIQNAEKQKEVTELETLRAKIVEAKIMDADAAGELTLNVARALAKPIAAPAGTVPAYALNSAFVPTSGNGASAYKVPEAKD